MTIKLAAAAAVLALSSALLAPAAHAATTVTATGSHVTYLKQTCYTSEIDYSDLDPASSHTLEVLDPTGVQIAAETSTGETTHSFPVSLCVGEDRVGTYAILADGSQVGSFTVTKPSLTLVRTHPRTMAVRLKADGKALAGRHVVFQVAYGGTHYDLITITTDRYGLGAITCTKGYRCPETYRYAYQGFVYSSHFHLYAGSANGRLAAGQRGVAPVAAS